MDMIPAIDKGILDRVDPIGEWLQSSQGVSFPQIGLAVTVLDFAFNLGIASVCAIGGSFIDAIIAGVIVWFACRQIDLIRELWRDAMKDWSDALMRKYTGQVIRHREGRVGRRVMVVLASVCALLVTSMLPMRTAYEIVVGIAIVAFLLTKAVQAYGLCIMPRPPALRSRYLATQGFGA